MTYPAKPQAIVAMVLLLVAGCYQPAAQDQQGPAAPANPTVSVKKPELKPLKRIIEQPAQVEAFEETQLIARIPGSVGKVNADIGDIFEPDGLPLAELSVPELVKEHEQKVALVKQAEAEVARARAILEAARAHAATAESQIHEADAARDKVQFTYQRWQTQYQQLEELVAKKALDVQARDEALKQVQAATAANKEMEAKVKSAKALHAEALAQADKAQADVDAAAAAVLVAKANEANKAVWLSYSQIKAPYKCVVVKRDIHTGSYLQPGTGSSSQPLFVVDRIDKLRISVEIPEVDAGFIQEKKDKLEALIRVPTIKDRDFKGKIVRQAWAVDPKARTLRVEIDLTNDDNKLRPGMYAYASFTVDLGERLTVPASAIVTQGDNTFCWFVVDGKAKRTPVRIGVRDGQTVEALRKQVTSGNTQSWVEFSRDDMVIISGQGSLTDNQAVNVKN
jgi:RND family efflux transporter MFP subunit